MLWREASVSICSAHYFCKDFCLGHILLWAMKDSSCPEGSTGELFRNLPLPTQVLLSKGNSLILNLKKLFAKLEQKEDFFFFIFHIRSKQIVGQKHKLASQLATSNYSSKYLRMPVDYRKQNCRDTNSPGKHVHETEEFHGRKGVCCGKVSEF